MKLADLYTSEDESDILGIPVKKVKIERRALKAKEVLPLKEQSGEECP